MNELKKKQLEIAKKIVELNGCDGIPCYGTMGLFKGNKCPFVEESMCNHCTNDRAVSLSKAYLKKHSKISRKDLLERIEKLEEKVDCERGAKTNAVDGAVSARCDLESKIAILMKDYKNKTGNDVTVDLVYT